MCAPLVRNNGHSHINGMSHRTEISRVSSTGNCLFLECVQTEALVDPASLAKAAKSNHMVITFAQFGIIPFETWLTLIIKLSYEMPT